MRTIVIDCETKNSPIDITDERCWRDFGHLGISIACAWISWQGGGYGRYLFFSQDRIDVMVKCIEKAEQIISFNGIKFDLPLIEHLHGSPIKWPAHQDLCVQIQQATGRRYSLEAVAMATLKSGKSGKGSHAVHLWQNGEYDKLYTYCMDDVRITMLLYKFIERHGFVFVPDGSSTKPVWISRDSKPLQICDRTSKLPATEKQIKYLQSLKPGWLPLDGMTKQQASDMIAFEHARRITR